MCAVFMCVSFSLARSYLLIKFLHPYNLFYVALHHDVMLWRRMPRQSEYAQVNLSETSKITLTFELI